MTAPAPTLAYATEKPYPFHRVGIAALFFLGALLAALLPSVVSLFVPDFLRVTGPFWWYFIVRLVSHFLALVFIAAGILVLFSLPRSTRTGRTFAGIAFSLAAFHLACRALALITAAYSFYSFYFPPPIIPMAALRHAQNAVWVSALLTATLLQVLVAIFLVHIANRTGRRALAWAAALGLALCTLLCLTEAVIYALHLANLLPVTTIISSAFQTFLTTLDLTEPAVGTLAWTTIALLAFKRPRASIG